MTQTTSKDATMRSWRATGFTVWSETTIHGDTLVDAVRDNATALRDIASNADLWWPIERIHLTRPTLNTTSGGKTFAKATIVTVNNSMPMGAVDRIRTKSVTIYAAPEDLPEDTEIVFGTETANA